MEKLKEYFFKTMEFISIVFLYAMVILVFLNVICRYFFKTSLVSTEEVSRFLFIWIAFIGSTLALKSGEHLSIDLIKNKLPKKIIKYVDIFSECVVLIVSIFLLIGGTIVAKSGMTVFSPATNIAYGIVDSIIPITAFFMCLIQFQRIYLCFKKKDHQEKLDSEIIIEKTTGE